MLACTVVLGLAFAGIGLCRNVPLLVAVIITTTVVIIISAITIIRACALAALYLVTVTGTITAAADTQGKLKSQ